MGHVIGAFAGGVIFGTTIGILRPDQLTTITGGMAGTERLTLGTNSMLTLRATAQNRLANGTLSDTRRSVAALVELIDRSRFNEPCHILRWYDNVWVQ